MNYIVCSLGRSYLIIITNKCSGPVNPNIVADSQCFSIRADIRPIFAGFVVDIKISGERTLRVHRKSYSLLIMEEN